MLIYFILQKSEIILVWTIHIFVPCSDTLASTKIWRFVGEDIKVPKINQHRRLFQIIFAADKYRGLLEWFSKITHVWSCCYSCTWNVKWGLQLKRGIPHYYIYRFIESHNLILTYQLIFSAPTWWKSQQR